jgi:hypothetical protein
MIKIVCGYFARAKCIHEGLRESCVPARQGDGRCFRRFGVAMGFGEEPLVSPRVRP